MFESKTSFESVRRCTYAASRSFKNSKSKADLEIVKTMLAVTFKKVVTNVGFMPHYTTVVYPTNN